MKTKTMTTLHLKRSIGRSPMRLAFLLIPLSLAIFTSPVDAQHRATIVTPVQQVQLQVPSCNVNGFVTLSGTIILDTEVHTSVISTRAFANVQVRPDMKADLEATTHKKSIQVEGTTHVSRATLVFLNGLATLTFPGSFKVESAAPPLPVRFEIQYTAHLTFTRLVRGFRVSGSYDNLKVVCL
jgi:hypothetical protein